jgi:hypothetical protein
MTAMPLNPGEPYGIRAGTRWRHWKGGMYMVLGTGWDATTDPPQVLVIYEAEADCSLWVRPMSEWLETIPPNSAEASAPRRFTPIPSRRRVRPLHE